MSLAICHDLLSGQQVGINKSFVAVKAVFSLLLQVCQKPLLLTCFELLTLADLVLARTVSNRLASSGKLITETLFHWAIRNGVKSSASHLA
ncbi:hypothetical protein SMQE13_30250 [Serratia marcescens]|nr:hypothetical protein SMQE13_30250 [Serratia marcescens]